MRAGGRNEFVVAKKKKKDNYTEVVNIIRKELEQAERNGKTKDGWMSAQKIHDICQRSVRATIGRNMSPREFGFTSLAELFDSIEELQSSDALLLSQQQQKEEEEEEEDDHDDHDQGIKKKKKNTDYYYNHNHNNNIHNLVSGLYRIKPKIEEDERNKEQQQAVLSKRQKRRRKKAATAAAAELEKQTRTEHGKKKKNNNKNGKIFLRMGPGGGGRIEFSDV